MYILYSVYCKCTFNVSVYTVYKLVSYHSSIQYALLNYYHLSIALHRLCQYTKFTQTSFIKLTAVYIICFTVEQIIHTAVHCKISIPISCSEQAKLGSICLGHDIGRLIFPLSPLQAVFSACHTWDAWSWRVFLVPPRIPQNLKDERRHSQGPHEIQVFDLQSTRRLAAHQNSAVGCRKALPLPETV